MNPYALSEAQMLVFALVLLRMIGFIFSSAIFGNPAVSVQVRILFCLVLTTLTYPLVKVSPEVVQGFGDSIGFMAAREVLVGLVLGFLTRLYFFAVSMTGDLVSISLGLGSAQLYNPMMESQSGVVEQFHVILGSMFFLLIDGHHVMISSLVRSYEMLPIGLTYIRTGGLGEIAIFGQDLFVLTLKMAAPVVVAILLANIAMGILGRAIPQLNVLVTSFPVTIMLGFGVMIVCMPLFVFEMNGLVDITATKLVQVMKSL